jgi:hypothetical protein
VLALTGCLTHHLTYLLVHHLGHSSYGNFRKEVGVVQMRSDMYRDHGEYVSTVGNWGSKGVDGCPLTDTI